IIMRRDNAAKGEDKMARVPLNALASANLVLTDELVREALKRDKALRQANSGQANDNNPAAGWDMNENGDEDDS
ncbi:MAG: hypothetical protein AAGK38_06745, partial [Pseudomonadota bacterium]